MSAVVGLIGIILALVIFLVAVYKGFSSYWVAPVCAIIVAVFNRMAPETLISSYVSGIVDLITSLFFIVFFGAMLGKLYNDTGAASSIAKTLTNTFVIKRSGDAQVRAAILVVLIISALLTMGGIDGYVLAFTMIPICFVMSEMVDIPRRFIPGMMILNCGFMAAPGAPQIDNIMAQAAIMSGVSQNEALAPYLEQGFHISSTAGLVPGIVAVIIIAGGGYFVLTHMILKAKHQGEHFDWGHCQKMNEGQDRPLPNFVVALIPLVLVFCAYTLFPAITGITVNIAIALGIGIVAAIILMGRNLPKTDALGNTQSIGKAIIATLNGGSDSYPNALMTVITPSALAAVVTATSAFGFVISMLAGIHAHYIVIAIIAVCVIVAITSSPPAALMVSLPIVLGIMLGQGYAPEQVIAAAPAVARVGALAATTFETLPINGLIILTLGLTGTTHKEAYKPMFVMSVLFTLIGTIVAGVLLIVFPGLA